MSIENILNRSEMWTNNKSGEIYLKITDSIDCTNARDGLETIIYAKLNDPTRFYHREKEEFYEKFTKITNFDVSLNTIRDEFNNNDDALATWLHTIKDAILLEYSDSDKAINVAMEIIHDIFGIDYVRSENVLNI